MVTEKINYHFPELMVLSGVATAVIWSGFPHPGARRFVVGLGLVVVAQGLALRLLTVIVND